MSKPDDATGVPLGASGTSVSETSGCVYAGPSAAGDAGAGAASGFLSSSPPHPATRAAAARTPMRLRTLMCMPFGFMGSVPPASRGRPGRSRRSQPSCRSPGSAPWRRRRTRRSPRRRQPAAPRPRRRPGRAAPRGRPAPPAAARRRRRRSARRRRRRPSVSAAPSAAFSRPDADARPGHVQRRRLGARGNDRPARSCSRRPAVARRTARARRARAGSPSARAARRPGSR